MPAEAAASPWLWMDAESVSVSVAGVHWALTSDATRSGAAKGELVPVPWLFDRNVFSPAVSQFVAGWAGMLPSSFTFVTEYACWFHTFRVFTHPSFASRNTRMPLNPANA